MNETKELIVKLKQVRAEKGYSLNEIYVLVEANGDCVSRSSIQRVFADGSEDVAFRYEDTLRPIAKALLNIEAIDDSDDLDTQTLKILLKYKIQRIEELEAQLDREKLKYHEKLDHERDRFNRSVDFLKNQIILKDKRIDILLESLLKDNKL